MRRLDADAQQRALAAALAALRPEEREVILLHAWAGLSDDEIAAALALPVGTVKSRLHRTRAAAEPTRGERQTRGRDVLRHTGGIR